MTNLETLLYDANCEAEALRAQLAERTEDRDFFVGLYADRVAQLNFAALRERDALRAIEDEGDR